MDGRESLEHLTARWCELTTAYDLKKRKDTLDVLDESDEQK
jgi:hypothetical protein